MYWAKLNRKQLGQVDRRTPLVLPIGAIEQHGDHLPLETDTFLGGQMCSAMEARLPNGVLILPSVSVGCSAHHLDFAGTLSVSHGHLASYVSDVIASAAAHGFLNFLLFNSHGGNLGVLQVLTEQLGQRHGHCNVASTSWWRLAGQELMQYNESGPGGVCHAGEFETSLMLHLAPELVDRAAMQRGGNISPGGPRLPAYFSGDMMRAGPASLYRSMRDLTGNGVFGDPFAASAKKGELMMALIEQKFVELVQALQTVPQPTTANPT